MVTKENLGMEHICCAISNNKDVQVLSKKVWLADRFDEGLVFLKSVERGKCFIEYITAEYAWNPIEAPGYMYIDCLWVSGSFKGHGYSSDLLSECIDVGVKRSFDPSDTGLLRTLCSRNPQKHSKSALIGLLFHVFGGSQGQKSSCKQACIGFLTF